MVQEVEKYLALRPGETLLDCTLGGAGHSLALAPALERSGYIIGIDQDDCALATSTDRIKQSFPDLRFSPLRGNFADLDELLLKLQIPGVNAVLLDIGVSSYQLDTPQRGFSYIRDAPIDMRMDPGNQTLTAAELLNKNEAELAWIIRNYGEERWASRIASAIVRRREQAEIRTTAELADLVRSAIPAAARRDGGNPAKRTFQALRIAVNDELTALRKGLDAAIRWLLPGGRIVVISYHSLEDRIVKETFATLRQGCICPPQQPICNCGKVPVLSAASNKPLLATEQELRLNSRSASAKLRWAIKRSAAV